RRGGRPPRGRARGGGARAGAGGCPAGGGGGGGPGGGRRGGAGGGPGARGGGAGGGGPRPPRRSAAAAAAIVRPRPCACHEWTSASTDRPAGRSQPAGAATSSSRCPAGQYRTSWVRTRVMPPGPTPLQSTIVVRASAGDIGDPL